MSLKITEGDVTDEVKDLAFQSLMAPDEPVLNMLPAPVSPTHFLPAKFVTRLSTSLATTDGSEGLNWSNMLAEIDANGGFKGMMTGDINSIIQNMDLKQRAEMSDTIFTMMKEANIQPTLGTYVRIMHAHAAEKNAQVVIRLYNDMKTSVCPKERPSLQNDS